MAEKKEQSTSYNTVVAVNLLEDGQKTIIGLVGKILGINFPKEGILLDHKDGELGIAFDVICPTEIADEIICMQRLGCGTVADINSLGGKLMFCDKSATTAVNTGGYFSIRLPDNQQTIDGLNDILGTQIAGSDECKAIVSKIMPLINEYISERNGVGREIMLRKIILGLCEEFGVDIDKINKRQRGYVFER